MLATVVVVGAELAEVIGEVVAEVEEASVVGEAVISPPEEEEAVVGSCEELHAEQEELSW